MTELKEICFFVEHAVLPAMSFTDLDLSIFFFYIYIYIYIFVRFFTLSKYNKFIFN